MHPPVPVHDNWALGSMNCCATTNYIVFRKFRCHAPSGSTFLCMIIERLRALGHVQRRFDRSRTGWDFEDWRMAPWHGWCCMIAFLSHCLYLGLYLDYAYPYLRLYVRGTVYCLLAYCLVNPKNWSLWWKLGDTAVKKPRVWSQACIDPFLDAFRLFIGGQNRSWIRSLILQ